MKNLFENIENIKNSHFNLSFNKKINLKERYFINFLLNNSLKNRKLTLELEDSFFHEKLKEKDIERFLKLFFEKKIVLKNNSNNLFGIINLISCFLKINNKYIFFLSDTIYDYLSNNNNIILKYQLEILLKIDNESIKNLFFYLLINLKNNKEIVLNKKDLKKILLLNNEYNRFFDLENKFIFPTLKLIKEICNLEIQYLKTKNSKAINSKISSLKFILPDNNLIEENEKIFTLLKPYSIKEETKIFILKMLTINSFNYILQNIYYSIDHHKETLDDFLIESLKQDFANTYFENLVTSKLKNTKIIINLNYQFTSLKEFEKKLKQLIIENSSNEVKEILLLYTTFKEIITDTYDKMTKNKKNNFLYDYNKLFSQLENIHLYKEFYYEDSSFIYIAEFNTIQNSKIYILKKENSIEKYLDIN